MERGRASVESVERSFDRIYRIDRIGREGEESGFAVENIENIEKRGGRLSVVRCRLSFFSL